NNFNLAFIGLTGGYAKIQAAARSLGVDVEKPKTTTGNYEVTHGNNLLVFRPDHQARVVYVAGVSNTHLADDLATDLPKLPPDRTCPRSIAAAPDRRRGSSRSRRAAVP